MGFDEAMAEKALNAALGHLETAVRPLSTNPPLAHKRYREAHPHTKKMPPEQGVRCP